ncbi:uncharacterized protein LOC127702063 isoform X2 [Mytilus californianus]|uniref:uncharacterized protein LOC127702063 isoform X2 n=1 Tax=Mytilus californianus TaxID=6549 RepID=UPI002246A48D|nr:uncharacterized protein LOC127702063 isoform X2 [Mytilus californianus]
MTLYAARWLICRVFISICFTSFTGLEEPKLSLQEMLTRLIEMNKPTVNDDRHNKYCSYIMRLLSYFSGERCMVAGSTQEQTRLRIRQDEGDYDYLIISAISIPVSALQYREDLPCFVHINGLQLVKQLPTVQLIDGRYLPSNLLSEIRPEVFKHIRDFHKLLSIFGRTRRRNSLHVALDHNIKPGKTLVSYNDVDCPALDMKQAKSNPKLIFEHLKQSIDEQLSEGKDEMMSHLIKVANVIDAFSKADIKTDSETSNFLQTFGSIIGALSCETAENTNCQNITDTCPNEKFDRKNKQKYFYMKPKSNNIDDNTNREEFDKGDVILKYKSKSSKDFIPAFPLAGKPRFLDEWKQRKRVWPPEHVVDDIYNSEFFVVAKPALTKRERKKDFCLAYNNGEIKLARAMTSVQKKVVLILKAIKKSLLQDYSEILTTFHWKTAVYWNSETLNSLLLVDTEDNVFKLLIKVLDYMINCLRGRELQHFFIPSNLFAGMNENTSIEIANKITEIREHPIKALNVFFAGQTFDEIKYEKIPAEKVAEFRKAYNDPSESSKIDIIMAILKRFSSESKEKVRAALHDVLTDALPFFIEEMARRRDKSQVNSALEQLILSIQIRKESFIDMVVNHLLDKVREKELNGKNIAQIFWTLILEKVLNQ